MTWQEFTALLVFGAAMAFTPGPNTLLSAALAANRGLRPTLPFCVAVPVGWAVLLLLCTAGIGALVVAVPPLRLAIKAGGIAYLVWLAWKLARTRRWADADTARLDVSFLQGVGLQFVNIKAWLLALTIVAGWLVGRDDLAARLGIVLPVIVAFAFASNFAYAATGALLRDWLARGARLAWFNRAMALVLVATAAWMTTV